MVLIRHSDWRLELQHHIRNLDIRSIIELLQEVKDVDAALEADGSVALHLAALLSKEADAIAVAEVVLFHGANPNIQNSEGKTSVHVAALQGYSQLLNLLLLNGGDPLLGDVKGMSSLDCAHQEQHMEVVHHLNTILDSEQYDGEPEKVKKFSLSFWRKELVEVQRVLQPEGEIQEPLRIYHSHCSNLVNMKFCNEVSSDETDADILRKANGKTHPEKLSSVPSDSGIQYQLFPDDIRNQKEASYVAGVQVQEQNAFISPECSTDLVFREKVSCTKHLKHRIEKCYRDNDSDSDLQSFQLCLRKNLQDANIYSSFSNTCIQNQDLKPHEQSFEDFNIAQLSIDASHEFAANADTPDGSYISSLIENCGEDQQYAVTGEALDFDEDQINHSMKCHPDQTVDSPDGKLNPLVDSDNKEQSSIIRTGETEADITAPANVTKPELYTSVFLQRAPRKSKPKSSSSSCKVISPSLRTLALQTSGKRACQSSDVFCDTKNRETLGKDCSHKTHPCDTKLHKGTGTASSARSWQSVMSMVEEFVYQDKEAGITLIERRCPSLSSISSMTFTGTRTASQARINDSLQHRSSKASSDDPDVEQSVDSVGMITESVKKLNADQLQSHLKSLGFTPGPILPSTERIYQRHLLRLRRNPQPQQNECKSARTFSRELRLAVEDPLSIDWIYLESLERAMSSPFSNVDPLRHWRDGRSKTCFNYLLLDPRITQDLPLRATVLNKAEKFKCFITAVFYVGKGSSNRPYHHLYEAIKTEDAHEKRSDKTKHIHDIWKENVGVVCLHVFHNIIPVEAWTREAAMISAIGLGNLCNSINGTFYGPASTWQKAQQRQLGTHLLHCAHNIFLQEGERQLRPSDITLPKWMK